MLHPADLKANRQEIKKSDFRKELKQSKIKQLQSGKNTEFELNDEDTDRKTEDGTGKLGDLQKIVNLKLNGLQMKVPRCDFFT